MSGEHKSEDWMMCTRYVFMIHEKVVEGVWITGVR